jgi:hypothetical protein
MRTIVAILCVVCSQVAVAQEKLPVYLWHEPEWFEGVKGSFAYWTGAAKPSGSWGVAGPGISAEWSQGGESEWNSMGAPAEETSAKCWRDLIIPRSGNYKVWVRYVDHRNKTEPFRATIEQGGKSVLNGELGVKPVVPPNDEYQLFWGFSFGWGSLEAKLEAGPARLTISIDKAGEAWRQVDAVLITDDEKYVPVGREKPPFAYFSSFALQPKDGSSWRGEMKLASVEGRAKRKQIAGRDFSMWAGSDPDLKWWSKQDLTSLSLYDVHFQFTPPSDIRDKFHKQFAGKKDIPIMSWPNLLTGFHLGGTPDLSPDSPLRQWLERTKTPFYIMTNYASGNYNDKNGPATYAALTGPLADQFMGYIHGEAMGTGGVGLPDKPPAADRRGYADALIKHLRDKQAEAWSKIYKTKVAPEHLDKSISCLSVDSISLAHLFHEAGCKTVGYEIDATNAHAPMRIAFERGAARQYGGSWINYASGNFGDACNYFTQLPVVPRGAPSWFHSKYSITDGVTASWYRKLYYMNCLGGASAIYWEQNLTNQWMLPGPGTHPIQLSPFGRATEDFLAFVNRVPDRGEPYTPIGILLNYGHSYERVNYSCKMLHVFQEDKNDVELRELFNVFWHPSCILEGQPASPDVQSMPSGVYGDIFDVLVDRPSKSQVLTNYPIIWAAGDVQFHAELIKTLEGHLQRGGTLVVNINQARQLPAAWLGVNLSNVTHLCEDWSPDGDKYLPAVSFGCVKATLAGAKAIAWAMPNDFAGGKNKPLPLITRYQVGKGSVIATMMPNHIGLDERAHPALPCLMNGLTANLLPVEVRLANGQRPAGEIMYSVNRTKDGWLLGLYNHRGLDKTQTGIARVDRKSYIDVDLTTELPVASAKEWTGPSELSLQKNGKHTTIRLRVHPGDLQVVGLVTR